MAEKTEVYPLKVYKYTAKGAYSDMKTFKPPFYGGVGGRRVSGTLKYVALYREFFLTVAPLLVAVCLLENHILFFKNCLPWNIW